MAVETEELVLKSNVAEIAAKDAAALDRLLAKSDKLNDSTIAGDLAKAATLARVKAVTAELGKQIGIESKIAAFDAERAKASSDLAKQLKKLNDDASGKTASDAEKKAAKESAATEKRIAREVSDREKAAVKIQAANLKTSTANAKASAKEESDTVKRLQKDADAYDKHVRKMADAEYKTKVAASKKSVSDAATALKKKGDDEKNATEESQKNKANSEKAAAALAGLAIAGLVIAAKATLKFAELVIDQTSFRESSQRALDRLTKGSGAATYDMAVNAAVKFGLDKETTVAQTKALLQAGLDKETIPLALKAIADVSIDLGDEKGNALKEQLGKISRKSKFDAASVDGLAEAGVKAADVFEALKKKGESTTSVMARLKTNQVSAAEGIKAVLAAVEKSSGGAADATKSIPGLLNAISIRFLGLFDKIDTGPLKDVLRTVLELFEGTKGDQLKKEVTDLGTAIFGLLKPLNTAEGKKALSDGFIKAAAAAHDLAIVVGALERGLDRVGKGGGFAVLGAAIDVILRPLEDAAALIRFINGESGGDKGAATSAPANDNGSADVGANMALGTAKGIDDNAGAIGDSMVAAVNAAVKRAESILGIASPAKRLIATGKWSALGMAKGWNDNAGAVADAAAGTATASMAAASGGAAAGAGGAGGQGGVFGGMPSISITVMVQGGKGGEADAKAIAVAIEPEVRQMVRRIQRDQAEQGGSPASRVA